MSVEAAEIYRGIGPQVVPELCSIVRDDSREPAARGTALDLLQFCAAQRDSRPFVQDILGTLRLALRKGDTVCAAIQVIHALPVPVKDKWSVLFDSIDAAGLNHGSKIEALASLTPREKIPQTAAAIADALYFASAEARRDCLAALRKLGHKSVSTAIEEALTMSTDPSFTCNAATLLADWHCADAVDSVRVAMDNVASLGKYAFQITMIALSRLAGPGCEEDLGDRLRNASDEEQDYFLGNFTGTTIISGLPFCAAIERIVSETKSPSIKSSALNYLQQAQKARRSSL